MDIRANLYPCAHCASQGTCKTGRDGSSCAVCVKHHELKGQGHVGLACGTCGGLGQAEPGTERITKRYPVILSFLIVYPLFIGLFLAAAFKGEYFTPLLGFAGPLLGGVVGFYFNNRAVPQR